MRSMFDQVPRDRDMQPHPRPVVTTPGLLRSMEHGTEKASEILMLWNDVNPLWRIRRRTPEPMPGAEPLKGAYKVLSSSDGKTVCLFMLEAPYLYVFKRRGDRLVPGTVDVQPVGTPLSGAFSPDGKILLLASSTSPEFYRHRDGVLTRLGNAPAVSAGFPRNIAFRPTGDVAIVQNDSTAPNWAVYRLGASGESFTREVPITNGMGEGMAWTPGGDWLFINDFGSNSAAWKLYGVNAGATIFTDYSGSVSLWMPGDATMGAGRFTPDGRTLFNWYFDGRFTIHVFDPATPSLAPYLGPQGAYAWRWPQALAFGNAALQGIHTSRDGTLLAFTYATTPQATVLLFENPSKQYGLFEAYRFLGAMKRSMTVSMSARGMFAPPGILGEGSGA